MTRARLLLAFALVACGPRRAPVEAKDANADAGVVEVATIEAGSPSSAPPAASSGPRAATTDAVLRDAPALAVKWTAPIKGYAHPALALAGTREVVVALEPSGRAVVARDARSGAEVWRASAPAGVTWHDVGVGKAHAYGFDQDGVTSAVRLADGTIAWTQRDLQGLAIGRDGSGLSVGSKTTCAIQIVDPASGRRFPAGFVGHTLRYRPMRGPDGNYTDNGHQRCVDTVHVLGQRGGATIAVVEDAQLRGAKLGAIDTGAPAPTFRWSVPFTSPHVFVARIEERGAVVWTEESDLVVVRVDFGAGNAAWKRSLPHREHCAEPRRQVRMVDDVLVVQSCNTVMRLDPKTGNPMWSRDVGDAIAALEGESMPPGDYEAFAESGPRPFVVQWLDRATGTPKARATIPSAAHDMALAKDGALFLERKETVLGVMGMIGLDGVERWRRGPALFGYVAVGRFVATGWEREPHGRHDHALLDPRTGDVVGIAPETNHVVGAIPERAPELLLASGPNAVTAFVIPPKP